MNTLSEEISVKEHTSGTKTWRLNGKRHRANGLAIEHCDGSNFWYNNGKLHREDGPAIERRDGQNE